MNKYTRKIKALAKNRKCVPTITNEDSFTAVTATMLKLELNLEDH